MPTYTLTGAHVRLYVNNKVFNTAQSINFTIDYGETPTYGIDSPHPQEIATTRVSVSGSVQGIRLKMSGGLQGSNMRPLFTDLGASPYVSIRIQDRQSGEDIMFCPLCKVTKESHSIPIKGTYKLSFDFVGSQPLMALDRSN